MPRAWCLQWFLEGLCIQSNPISDDSFINCPPMQNSWASCHELGLLYQSCHLGFLLRQAGWQGALAHCQPWQSPVLCQLCLHCPCQSTLAGQKDILSSSLTNQPFAPRTKPPLCARTFALLTTCSCTSWAVLKPHTPVSRPCPVPFSRTHQH